MFKLIQDKLAKNLKIKANPVTPMSRFVPLGNLHMPCSENVERGILLSSIYREPDNKGRNAEFPSFLRRITKEKETLTCHTVVQDVKKAGERQGSDDCELCYFTIYLRPHRGPSAARHVHLWDLVFFDPLFGPSFTHTLSGSRKRIGVGTVDYGLRACDAAEQTQINRIT